MSVDSLLTHTVDVQKVTETADAIGGMTEVWSDRYTALSVRIQPLSARERILYQAPNQQITHRMYCLKDDISPKDRVWFLGRGTVYRMFRVVGVRSVDEFNPVRLVTIDLVETTGESVPSTTSSTTTSTTTTGA